MLLELLLLGKPTMRDVTLRSPGNRFEIRLVNWRFMLVYPDNTRHVVGIDARESTGRVSSAIKDFDPKTGRVNTYSRRVYVLVGSSRHDAKAQCVWNQWCSVNGVSGCTEKPIPFLSEGAMTTPEERTRAILGGRELLATLAQGRGAYSPDLVRTLAMTLLRHYPRDVDIDVSAAAIPHLWAEPAMARRRPSH